MATTPNTTRQALLESEPVKVTVSIAGMGDQVILLTMREFDSGSMGYHTQQRFMLPVGEGVEATAVEVMLGCCTVVGSKGLSSAPGAKVKA